MYYVYIVKSQKDGSYYTGFTSDLDNRIKEHNSGSGDYSSTKTPFALIWYCCFQDKLKAILIFPRKSGHFEELTQIRHINLPVKP
jgi:putative endonuclease